MARRFAMLAFNRSFIEFGTHVRGLERTDDILHLLWRRWTNTSKGGGGWWEFGPEVLTRTRVSTTNLKRDGIESPYTNDLLFRHDYGIDIILRSADAEPVYGGWIYAAEVKVSGRMVNGYRALAADGDGLAVSYTFDPSSGINVYRPENRAFDLEFFRKVKPLPLAKQPMVEARRKK